MGHLDRSLKQAKLSHLTIIWVYQALVEIEAFIIQVHRRHSRVEQSCGFKSEESLDVINTLPSAFNQQQICEV